MSTNSSKPSPRRAKATSFAALAAACLALAGCGEPVPPPSFVLVLVDTLRADRLGHAGHAPAETPRFDALQRESVWFRHAWASSSWTLPSIASLLLSQHPSQHGVASWGARLRGDQLTVVDRLRDAGYATAMLTANRIVAGGRGFADRFDHYALVEDPRWDGRGYAPSAFADARDLVADGLAWIRELRAAEPRRPFLAYLHFMEPHAPYLCAEAAGSECERAANRLNLKLLALDWEFDAAERTRVQQLYDADVTRMDRALGQLVDGLAELGVLDRTWVVLASDHGELLGEQGLYLHGRALWEALVHVPLLFRAPGAGRAGEVGAPVSLVDVAPTLLELAGLDVPESFVGRSLAPALAGGALEPRPAVAELLQVRPVEDARRQHLVAATDGDTQLLARSDGSYAAVELGAPGAPREAPASREQLEALLARAGLAFDPAHYGRGDLPDPTPEMLESLRRLGYLRD